jgi:DNA repair protein RadC
MSGSSPMFMKNLHGQYQVAAPDSVLVEAKRLLNLRVHKDVEMMSSHVVKDYLALQLGQLEYEVFVVLFLDTQHRLIECQEMFRGTLNQTSVYPREVVRVALTLNAGAVILAHNHPLC